jgi:hypothetical protein
MLTPSEATVKAAIANVWPYGENRETLHGVHYCHSGIFEPSRVRKIANLTRVTSVFCDIDFADLLKVVYPGAKVEDLKAKLYEVLCSDDDPCHADLMGCAAEALVEAIRESNLPLPSLVLCSGWGLHVHWALQRDTGQTLAGRVVAKDETVKQIHTVLDKRISARFPGLLRARMIKSGEWSPEVGEIFLDEAALSAWGAEGVVDKQARDLGTRLVRYPGTFNTKQPQAIEVHALYASETILPNWSMLHSATAPAGEKALTAKQRIQAKRSADNAFLRQVEEAARKVSTPIPFHLTFVKAGRFQGMSLRAIGDEHLPIVEGEEPDPGEKINIVSPWRGGDGGSEGSAFIAREADGRLSVRCNITEKRYIDSVDPTVDPSGGDDTESLWSNRPGGAGLDRRFNKTDNRMIAEACLPNILKLLRGDAMFDTLFFDDFSQSFMMVAEGRDGGPAFLQSVSMDRIARLVEQVAWDYYDRFNLNAHDKLIKRALQEFSESPPDEITGRKYHKDWLKEYLLSYRGQWDGISRLDSWLPDVTGCANTPLYRFYGRKWMLQLAATGLGLGTAQAVLLLRGKQGGGKSSFGQILRWGKRRQFRSAQEKALPDAYTDQLTSPVGSARDMMAALAATWLVEDAEALVLSSHHTGAVKTMFSRDTIESRAMFSDAKRVVELRCCIYSSANEDVSLHDPTGSRRIFGVDVADRMDITLLAEIRDQLFAEAVTYLMSDEAQAELLRKNSPWLVQPCDTIEVNGVQVNVFAAQTASNSDGFSDDNLWGDYADAAFRMNAGGKENAFALSQFLLAVDDSISISKIPKAVRDNGAAALRKAGFKDFRPTGSSVKAWYAPAPHDQWVGVKQHGTGLSMLVSPDIRRKAVTATEKVVK